MGLILDATKQLLTLPTVSPHVALLALAAVVCARAAVHAPDAALLYCSGETPVLKQKHHAGKQTRIKTDTSETRQELRTIYGMYSGVHSGVLVTQAI